MCCNFVNTLFSCHEGGASKTGLAIGSIKARDEISEVVVVIKMRMFRLSVMNLSSKTRSFKIVFWTTYIIELLIITCQTRVLRKVSKVRVRSDVNISSVHNVIYRISLYTMFLVTFLAVSRCERWL